MGIEIERRFLARNEQWRARVQSSSRIEQGYFIADKELSIRVRIRHTQDGQSKATVTFKSFITDTSRHEFEFAIPTSEARRMLDTLPVFVISKTRHLVKIDEDVFEVDEYEGANASLVLVELEMDDADREYVKPSWLGAEVTHDGRYSNAYLSRHPYEQWSEEERSVIRHDGGSL